MFTLKYKGWFINGHFDRDECTVVLPNGAIWERTKSLLAAKRSISKAIKWVRVVN